jgi:cysteinyl-tRNA synthetase
MSKSIGNILYTDTLQEKGYDLSEIRFFLIYGHYRKRLNYSDKRMRSTTEKLRRFKKQVKRIEDRAGHFTDADTEATRKINDAFRERMDDDLDVKGAFDNVAAFVFGIDLHLNPTTASGIIKALKEIDEVLQIF